MIKYLHFCFRQNFSLLSVKAFQILEIPNLYKGFVWPTHNVATGDRGAIVLSGENSEGLLCSDSMISSAILESNGFTSHRLGSGQIVIQFGQPYYVGSFRLLLWDPEIRSYRFYVQTSMDNECWTLAVDMREIDMTPSSQSVFNFAPRLVLYVKIIGIECSVKEDKVRIKL